MRENCGIRGHQVKPAKLRDSIIESSLNRVEVTHVGLPGHDATIELLDKSLGLY